MPCQYCSQQWDTLAQPQLHQQHLQQQQACHTGEQTQPQHTEQAADTVAEITAATATNCSDCEYCIWRSIHYNNTAKRIFTCQCAFNSSRQQQQQHADGNCNNQHVALFLQTYNLCVRASACWDVCACHGTQPLLPALLYNVLHHASCVILMSAAVWMYKCMCPCVSVTVAARVMV